MIRIQSYTQMMLLQDVGAFRVTEIDPVIQLQEVGIAIGSVNFSFP